jgi:glycerol uptake facilitator-like aquaporin
MLLGKRLRTIDVPLNPLSSLSNTPLRKTAPFGTFSTGTIWAGLSALCARTKPNATPVAVAAYITSAYWFTASTSFANPVVTVARVLSNTFARIRPANAPLFLIAQIAGALAATFLFRWLVPGLRANAEAILVPHETTE